MNGNNSNLFSQYELRALLQKNFEDAKQDVESIPEDQFNNSDDEALSEHVFSKREIFPISLNVDAMEMEKDDTEVDVRYDPNRLISDKSRPFLKPGLNITVTIPFSGDASLWQCRPSTSSFSLSLRDDIIVDSKNDNSGYLKIILVRPSDTLNGQTLRSEIDGHIADITSLLKHSGKDVEDHNKGLKAYIQSCIKDRRKKLGVHLQCLSDLNIPLKKRPGAPDVTPIPLKSREIKPLPSKLQQQPEYGITDDDFEYMLKVIRHGGRTYETTPATYAIHDEEGLRDIILAMLNSHFEGAATGETFRKNGKTDIRIESNNRAAFVAECKLWRGGKELHDAIDQLLGYLTWRDCKASLIIFNKDVAGFSDIQKKLPGLIKEHQRFIREEEISEPGEWRYVIKSAEDEERHISLHIFLFNLFVRK